MPTGRIFITGFFILATTWAAGNPEEKPSILVVQSYHVGMPWVDGVNQGLHTALKDKAELVITQLDVKRFPGPGREKAMGVTLASKAAMCQAKAIITMDDYALSFCLEHRQELFPGLPIIFGGVNIWQEKQPPNTTGIMEAIEFENTLLLMNRLFPHSKRLVVINDSTETGKANRTTLEQALTKIPWATVLHLDNLSFEETEAKLRTLSPETDSVLLLSWNLDAKGHTRSYEEAVERARKVCPAPIFGVWDFYLGNGILGGYLLDSRVHGQEVGEMAARVLETGSADLIPIVYRCRSRLALDGRELARFGVPSDRVPREAELSFVHKSLLSEYKLEISLALLVISAQGVTITILVLGRRRRLLAETGLRKSEERMRLTLASIGQPVFTTDENGDILRMNPAAERIAGGSTRKLAGHPYKDVFNFIQEKDGTPHACIIKEALACDAPCTSQRPQWIKTAGGAERLILVSAAPLHQEGEAHAGVVVVLHDITETAHLEQQLRQSQKMESIGLLAGGVAHDFNNLLQIIQGSLQLMCEPDCTEQEHRESALQINEAVGRASSLTSQLLAFGRKQKLDIHSHDLAQLVENLLKMLGRLIGENITLRFSEKKGIFYALTDKHQLEQVVLNLCLNARDAMPQGGSLSISLDEITFTPEDAGRQAWVKPGRFIQVSISDTGCGMSKELQQKIFDPFFTTKPLGKGTGLGLAVVQGIIVQHQGFIMVYSEPGHGSTFRFYLPAGEHKEAPKDQAGPSESSLGRANLQEWLLYAEDDKMLRETTTKLLQRCGYKVLACATGEEACEQAAKDEHPFAVAILDVIMPGMGGIEAAKKIIGLRPSLPIIFCSGYAEQTLSKAELPPGWRHLAKPYPAGALISLINSATASRQGPVQGVG